MMTEYELALVSERIQKEIDALEEQLKLETQREIILIPYEKLEK